jgi:hypothetical protein
VSRLHRRCATFPVSVRNRRAALLPHPWSSTCWHAVLGDCDAQQGALRGFPHRSGSQKEGAARAECGQNLTAPPSTAIAERRGAIAVVSQENISLLTIPPKACPKTPPHCNPSPHEFQRAIAAIELAKAWASPISDDERPMFSCLPNLSLRAYRRPVCSM